uniref:Ubiquitin-like-conjugating enzyme ATG10 n=1 Tax=Kalanchoe fedtschenkoi TaxID=63787 RepID=A0A7N0TUK3_KALFE
MCEIHARAQFLVDKWKTVIDSAQSPWSWVPSSSASASHNVVDDEGVQGYLSLENVCLFKPCQKERDPNHIEEEEEVEEEAEEYEDGFTDTAMLVQRHDMTLRHYDLHILYSDSYRVPVLFFRAYFTDGSPLSLGDIEKDLPLSHANESSDSKWTFITLEEHPYLNRPWHKLHPCGTSEWMKLLYLGDSSSTDRNRVGVELYLLIWLSVVGPMVGLKVPIKAAKQLIDRS